MTTLSKKVCLLGDFAVGKTSLVRRFVYNRFDDKYISTIGVKVSRKTVSVSVADRIVDGTMMLWDLAGSEEFDRVRTSYLRGAAGAVLVCDLTRPETLDSLQKYANGLLKANANIHFILAANKYDLTERHALTLSQIDAVATGFKAPFYISSAKTGNEVEAIFRHLGQILVT